MSHSQPVATNLAASSGPATPVTAVNLRDIGEIDPRLRKGVLYRCSQIYTPQVLRDLKIKTVVDLRGRAERDRKRKSTKHGEEGQPAISLDSGRGPPALLGPDEVDALHASTRQREAALAPGTSAQPSTGPAAGQAEGGERLGPGPGPDAVSQDMLVTRLKRSGEVGGSVGGSIESLDSEDEGSGSNNNNNNNNGGIRRKAGHEEVVAAMGDEWQQPMTEAFNVIPGRQFGYAMLRMPLRVWRGAFGNLVTGKDPRRPFVDAFADEQLLGFTRYYKIILEHAKKNIAGVMRVFTKDSSYPSLVHCAHGKDRTGVIIMLLLMLCDVPHEEIVKDYVQSEIELRRYRESLGLPDPTGATGAVIPLNEVIIASTAETLRALLAYMDSTYITVDNYLISCGMTQEELAAIRRNLLRPDAEPAAAPAGSGVAQA